MNKYKVYFEKNDVWKELGIFNGETLDESLKKARNSDALLEFFSQKEVEYVNLEGEIIQD
ncbi:hypothetical protein EIJ82_00285 [Alkalihalobacillus clausii]|nr:hypothetical protein [Shouchella clausii]